MIRIRAAPGLPPDEDQLSIEEMLADGYSFITLTRTRWTRLDSIGRTAIRGKNKVILPTVTNELVPITTTEIAR